MKFWESPIIKSLGWKEEPKGIAKMSMFGMKKVCMLIVIVMSIFMPSSILEIKIVSTITWAFIIIFFVLLAWTGY